MKKQFLILFLVLTCSLSAQDQVKVMYYNFLNYPSSSPERSDTLRKNVQYVKPDLFLVNELQSNTGANLILANSLNQWGTTYYQKAAFVNGPDTDNMLFYNSEKFGLISQLKRATNSISANLAEGTSRNTNKDKAHFTTLAYSSTMEVLNHLILSKELNFILKKNI